jgi:hypothetical protein
MPARRRKLDLLRLDAVVLRGVDLAGPVPSEKVPESGEAAPDPLLLRLVLEHEGVMDHARQSFPRNAIEVQACENRFARLDFGNQTLQVLRSVSRQPGCRVLRALYSREEESQHCLGSLAVEQPQSPCSMGLRAFQRVGVRLRYVLEELWIQACKKELIVAPWIGVPHYEWIGIDDERDGDVGHGDIFPS